MQLFALLGVCAEGKLGQVIICVLKRLQCIGKIAIIIMLLCGSILVLILGKVDCILTLLK
ncbi:hypothetical protein AYJ66_17485 [Dietzia cinnamea]|nr:hypothetical protein AYJ66_17485 [Dietzia cinnamea]